MGGRGAWWVGNIHQQHSRKLLQNPQERVPMEISKCGQAAVSPLHRAKSEEHLAAGHWLLPRVLISMCGFSSKPESASERNESLTFIFSHNILFTWAKLDINHHIIINTGILWIRLAHSEYGNSIINSEFNNCEGNLFSFKTLGI